MIIPMKYRILGVPWLVALAALIPLTVLAAYLVLTFTGTITVAESVTTTVTVQR